MRIQIYDTYEEMLRTWWQHSFCRSPIPTWG